MLIWTWNDGGRKDAGYKGQANDCTCRAITIVSGRPYEEIYSDLNEYGAAERRSKHRRGKSSARTGVHIPTIRRYVQNKFPAAIWIPTMHIGSGCTVHLRADELPRDRPLLVSVSRHMTTMMYGVIHDTHDPSRGGTRCVYGYWIFPDRI
jgi:hypothetical protein